MIAERLEALTAATVAVMTSACAPDDGVCATATRSIADGVTVQTQEELDALADVSFVQGQIGIFGDVEDLSPLACLRSAGAISIGMTPQLTAIPDLPELSNLGNLVVIGAPELTEIGAMPLLRELERISLRDAPQLSAIRSIGGVKSVFSFSLENVGVVDLSFASGLESAWSVSLINNQQLQTLEGLSGLRTVDSSLTIWGNPSLEPCADWELARQLETTPELNLQTPEVDCPL